MLKFISFFGSLLSSKCSGIFKQANPCFFFHFLSYTLNIHLQKLFLLPLQLRFYSTTLLGIIVFVNPFFFHSLLLVFSCWIFRRLSSNPSNFGWSFKRGMFSISYFSFRLIHELEMLITPIISYWINSTIQLFFPIWLRLFLDLGNWKIYFLKFEVVIRAKNWHQLTTKNKAIKTWKFVFKWNFKT